MPFTDLSDTTLASVVVNVVAIVPNTSTRSGRMRSGRRGEWNMCWCGCGELHDGTMVRCRADSGTRLLNPHCSYCSATWKYMDHRIQYINVNDVEISDVIESESDEELVALPGEFEEHDDSDENDADNEIQLNDDDDV